MNTRILDNEGRDLEWDRSAYDGVRTKRVLAFLVDYAIVGLLMIPVTLLIVVLGLLTLGFGWLLFGIMVPAVALIYVWWTLGGPHQATLGMRLMGIRLERLDGGPVDGMLAVVHSVLFWAGNTVLTPLVLLVTLFNDQKRALHDLLLGTVVMRTPR
jgi:uncharacterized RDD family membrane protein YckC